MLATIPLTAAIWVIEFLPGPVPAPTLDDALLAYLNVLAIGASVTVVFYLLERGKAEPAAAARPPSVPVPGEPASVPETPRQPAFLDRLPAELDTGLIALEMEDHYVRAHTMLGSDLVLLRMRDAIAELEGVEGAQVHRSWWVARDAVERVEREGPQCPIAAAARAGLRRWRAAAPRNSPRRAGSNPLAVPQNAA